MPEDHTTGALKGLWQQLPLGGWWKDVFEKLQPGIKIEYDLQTTATAVPCVASGLADIGIMVSIGCLYQPSIATLRTPQLENPPEANNARHQGTFFLSG